MTVLSFDCASADASAATCCVSSPRCPATAQASASSSRFLQCSRTRSGTFSYCSDAAKLASASVTFADMGISVATMAFVENEEFLLAPEVIVIGIRTRGQYQAQRQVKAIQGSSSAAPGWEEPQSGSLAIPLSVKGTRLNEQRGRYGRAVHSGLPSADPGAGGCFLIHGIRRILATIATLFCPNIAVLTLVNSSGRVL